MSCNKPLSAYLIRGSVSFSPDKNGDHIPIELPCGKCTQCRIDNSREKAIKMINEASMHDDNCFITLTYDNEHLPKDKNLDYDEFKGFMKRLREHLYRKEGRKIKYFACGEYGGDLKNTNNIWTWDRSYWRENNKPMPTIPRAHFHAIIFNWWPKDSELFSVNHLKQEIHVSKEMKEIWGNGNVSHGTVTPMSCGYVARYIMKKQNSSELSDYLAKYGQPLYDEETGEYICDHPEQPEMAYGSTRPPIGVSWLEKYWETDCFNQGFILGPAPEHKKFPIPRTYWEWLEKNHYEDFKVYKRLKDERYLLKKDKIEADNTFERRESKDKIITQKVNKLHRSL